MSEPVENRRSRWLRRVTQHPRRVVGTILVATLLALAAIVDPFTGTPRLLLDPSIESMLRRDDPGLAAAARANALFDGGELLLVAIAADDVFVPEVLERLKRLTERIEDQPEVRYASSLATALNIRSERGELQIEPFYDDVPTDPSALADLRRRALADPIYAGNLVSFDGRVAAISIALLDLSDRDLIESGFDERLGRIAAEEAGGLEVWIAGGSHVKAETNRLMLGDLGGVLPFSVLLMALAAFASFRTLRGVALPLATVGVGLVWTMALVGTLFGELNPVTVAAPPVIIAVGFAYAVHVVSAYYARAAESPAAVAPADLATDVLRRVIQPICFTGLTTAIGFFSLATSPIVAVREFAVFCAVGVLATTFVSITLGPACLALLRRPAPRSASEERPAESRFEAFLRRIARFDLRHRDAVMAVWLLATVVAAAGIGRIEISTDMVSNLRADNPVRLDFDRVNAALGGANAFQILVESPEPDDFLEPARLETLVALQTWLAEQPEVAGSTSFADYVRVLNQGFREGDRAALRVPESRALVGQLLVLGGNEEVDRFVDADRRAANVVVRTSAIDSVDVMALVGRIEERLATLPAPLEAEVTGQTVLLSRTMDEIALGQALSLATAIALIYLVLALLFTSLKTGLLALAPNLIPIAIYFGVLGWTGVTLNITTGLVACMVLGIAVDDTIHLLVHFKEAARRHADEERGVLEAVAEIGRPVTVTTLALCLGFLALLMSEIRAQVEFGVLAAVILAIAWANDLTFTPSLATRMRIVSLWDVLTLDLGDAPDRTIPLFAGLRPWQARIVALMAELIEVPADRRFLKQGERGDALYVVIDGLLEASTERPEGSIGLRSMRRGDLVGEAAVFTGERTADVWTRSEVRLLRLERTHLEDLTRRHPRIAARVLGNLSGVLAERLGSVTGRVA